MITQNYFSFISIEYTCKNKLETAILALLKSKERMIIPAGGLTQFKNEVSSAIEKLNAEHTRCHPIRPEWWNPRIEKADTYLSLEGKIAVFHVYAERPSL